MITDIIRVSIIIIIISSSSIIVRVEVTFGAKVIKFRICYTLCF